MIFEIIEVSEIVRTFSLFVYFRKSIVGTMLKASTMEPEAATVAM
jgi:hypothetical protein